MLYISFFYLEVLSKIQLKMKDNCLKNFTVTDNTDFTKDIT